MVDSVSVPAWVNEAFFYKLCKSIISDKDFKVTYPTYLTSTYLPMISNYALHLGLYKLASCGCSFMIPTAKMFKYNLNYLFILGDKLSG